MAYFSGTSAHDSYWGGSDADRIEGLGGHDYLLGNGGNDEIFGGEGDDNLHGGADDDLLEGGEGNDLLQGDEGVDILRGQAGNDRLLLSSDYYLGVAGDSIDGGDGVDTLQFDGLWVSSAITFSIADPAVAQSVAGATIVNVERLSFRGGRGNDDVTGGALDDYIDGFDGNDRIEGGEGNDSLDGGSGTDTIYGGAGNDTITGGSGGTGDILYGGDGNDSFRFNQDSLIDGGAGTDSLRVEMIGGSGGPGVTVDLSNPDAESLVLGTRVIGIEKLIFSAGPGDDRLTGGTGDDQLIGNGGHDVLVGGAGNDSLSGGDGNDQLSGGAGDDYLHNVTSDPNSSDLFDGGDGFDSLEYRVFNGTGSVTIDLLAGTGMVTNVEQISFSTWGSTGVYNVSGGAERDLIFGGGAGDTLNGRGGDDDLRGGAGDDVMDGGDGNDFVHGEGGANQLQGGGGDDIVRAYGPETSLMDGGAGDDMLLGGEGADIMTGGDGADILYGYGGADSLDGGSGSDYFGYSAVADSTSAEMDRIRNFESGQDKIDLTEFGDVRIGWVEATDRETGATYSLVTVRSASGTATIRVDSSLTRDDFLADTVTDGTFGNDSMVGTDEADEISGHGGNDVIQGKAGNDSLRGGAGDDILSGEEGDDLLNGGSGVDSMTGGIGNDVYTVDNAADLVAENAGEGTDEIRTGLAIYSLAGLANVEKLTAASDVNHDFRGNSGNNVIIGGAGNDNLRLQDGGDDIVDGGAGNDNIFMIGSLAAADAVNGGAGNDTLILQGDYAGGLTLSANVTNIELISILAGSNTNFGEPGTNRHDYALTVHDSNFSGAIQVRVNGSALLEGEDFTFDGSAELDSRFVVYGGRGKDTLTGSQNNDIFFFAEERFATGDTVNGGAGYDGMFLRGNYTIDFNAPGYAGLFTNIENLTLTSATDERYARGGGTEFDYNLVLSDAIVKPGETLTVSGTLLMTNETMILDASAESDGLLSLFGGKANDTLKGGALADVLYGNLGADQLTGNGGADVFRYNAAAESTSSSLDHIVDFAAGTDKVDLSRVDADSNVAGNQAFSWIGSNAFSGTAGQLRAYQDGSSWFVEGDTDGDGAADLVIQLTVTGGPLGQTDFLP